MTPICSVLMPSRNRVELLRSAITSFLDTAQWPDRVEIIVRVHEEDYPSVSWALLGTRPKQVRVVVGDTEEGYASLYKFINCVAAVSSGDWLWGGADDAQMVTTGWDRVLSEVAPDPCMACLMVTPTVVDQPTYTVPVISRGLYHTIGHFGLSSHPDCYLDSLAHFAGIKSKVDIKVKVTNPTWVSERDIPKTWAEYRGPKVAHRFNVDKIKLGAVLGRDLGKWTTSDAPKVP